jgi:hypothetical protein
VTRPTGAADPWFNDRQFGAATPMFKVRMLPTPPPPTLRDCDVAPDGRFFVGTVVGPAKGTAATIVLNWPSLVKK